MKKPNRIARKGDTAPTGAQSKATAASPAKSGPAAPTKTRNLTPIYGNEIACFDDQRLYRDGHTYYLVTDYVSMEQEGTGTDGPGQTVMELTRDQVRAWLDKTVIGEMIPHEFQRDFRHRNRGENATATLTLGELLSEDSIDELNQIGVEQISIAAQVSGAVESWLRYADHLRESGPDGVAAMKAAPGILSCEHYEQALSSAREDFVNGSGAQFYQRQLARAEVMPLKDAVLYLEGLADLIEYHPGLADERASLREFLDGECTMGRSKALGENRRAA